MIPEAGHFALILALLLSLVLGALALAGAQRSDAAWMAMARPAAVGQSLFVLLAWACLVTAFAQNDFSVRNVAENSNSLLPLQYRIAAAWGSHEGSMLLWLTLHSVWMLAVARFSRRLPAAVAARVLGVMGLLAAGFALFVLATSNPFLRVFPIPLEGRDLNPLLQDPGMVITRRCSTWATWDSPWRSPLRSRHCSAIAGTPPGRAGRAGRGRGRRSPGAS